MNSLFAPSPAASLYLVRPGLGFLLLSLLFFSLAPRTMGKGDRMDEVRTLAPLLQKREFQKAAAQAESLAKQAAEKRDKGRALFAAGYACLQLKDYDKARSFLRVSGRFQPLLAFHALYYGALSYFDEERYDACAKLLEKLLRSRPPGDLEAKSLILLLRAFRRGDKPHRAREVLRKIEALRPLPGEWKDELAYTRGWVAWRTGEYDKARRLLVKLWRERPASFWADQAEKLITGSSAAPMLRPGETSLVAFNDRIERIQNLIRANQGEKARKELRPLLASPGLQAARAASLHKLMGLAWQADRRFQNAISELEKAKALSPVPDPEIDFEIAECLRRSGKHQQAIALYRRLWTSYPRGPYATRSLYYAGRLFKLADRFSEAQAVYAKLATEYVHSSLRPEALFQLAWLSYLEGRKEEALSRLERVPVQRNSPGFTARTLYWKAVLLRQLGRAAQAERLEDELLQDYWKSAYAFYLAVVQGRQWPHPAMESKPAPFSSAPLPLEFQIAKELFRLGLLEDGSGQLNYLSEEGGLSENLVWAGAKMLAEAGDYFGSQRLVHRHLKSRLETPPPGELAAWRLAFPLVYPGLVERYSARYRLDPRLVCSVMRAESTYRPEIISPAGAVGLMQVMPYTGRQIAMKLGEPGFRQDLLQTPEVSVRYGCYYLAERLKEFENAGSPGSARLWRLLAALASYNAGPDRVKEWLTRAHRLDLSPEAFVEEIPLKETRQYVKRILSFYLLYLEIYPQEGGFFSVSRKENENSAEVSGENQGALRLPMR